MEELMFTVTDDLLNSTTDMRNASSDYGNEMGTTMMTTQAPPTTSTEAACGLYDWPPCEPYMRAGYYFAKYGILVSYAIGIPGSLLTLILLAKMRPFNSASVWLFSLSTFDFINLTFRLFRTVGVDYTQAWNWNDAYCRTYYIISYSTAHAGYLILTGLAVERFIAVWFPLKMSVWCKKRWAAMGVVGITTVCLASDLHMVKTMRFARHRQTCVIRGIYRSLWEYLYQDRIQSILLMVVPVVLLFTLNVLIIFRLGRSRGINTKISDEQAKEKQRVQKQINRMLIAASIWFLVCCVPDLIYRLTRHLWGSLEDRQSFVIRWVCYNVFPCLVLFNHSGNFLLYVIAARKFRSELIKLLTCNRFSLDSKGKFKSTSSASGTKKTWA